MWKERIAWLKRMPVHYRVLFGSQFLFMTWAFTMRQKMIAAAEKDRLNEVVPAKDVRQVYHEQMIKEKNGNLVKKDA
jgi:hypothetical protein